MRPTTLDHSCDRGSDGNMAFLQAKIFVISILCVFSFGSITDIIDGGQRVNLRCGVREHVEVTNVELRSYASAKGIVRKRRLLILEDRI